jgi:ATP adenylyltransferase
MERLWAPWRGEYVQGLRGGEEEGGCLFCELQKQDDESLDMQRLLQRCIRALKETMEPDGFNLGMNLGRVAGAGVPDHLHWHVVPRWNGDTNFMPTVAETKVLPERLGETLGKLRASL